MSLSPPSPESSSEPVDNDLVEQARAGDPTAFEKLFERYNDRICLYLVRMVGNDAIGCELAQEAFFKAWEALPSLRDTSHFASWLYRIATNVAHDHQRRVRPFRWIPWEEYKGQRRVEEISTAGPEERVEETELLKLALSHVSLTYRACLILYIVEEFPQRQIAERLGIKETSIGKYVSRGLEELRQIYFRLVNEQSTPGEERQKR